MEAQWFKYISFTLVGAAALLSVWYVFKKDHILNWLISSFQDAQGRPDSKKISAFLCVLAFIGGFFIIIYYDKDHNPPEFYVYTLAALIASFYGIREVGRYITTKNGNGTTNGDTTNGNGGAPPAQQPQQNLNQNTKF